MTQSSAVARLIASAAASRIHKADASLYDFSPEAYEVARNFMGWTTLSSKPPCDVRHIQHVAESFREKGFTSAILIGQGGSTQAPMTLADYLGCPADGMALYVLDSLAPASMRAVLAKVDLARTMLVVSSKSGTTLEVLTMLQVLRKEFCRVVPEQELSARLVAITDPGTKLEQQAKDEGWAAVLSGEPTVGGRFSALSVFGLFPAALMGVDLVQLIDSCEQVERACGQDCEENPAIQLAAFLYDSYQQGRDCMSFVADGKVKAFGLWMKQLVAESLGKSGLGIAPYLENNPSLLSRPAANRTVIVCLANTDAAAHSKLSHIHTALPRMDFSVGSLADLMGQFILWEYATALCGWLMEVCPFDQPDVQSAKTAVLSYLEQGLPAPGFVADLPGACTETQEQARVEVLVSPRVAEPLGAKGSEEASPVGLPTVLAALLSQIEPQDCLYVNAFLSTTDAGIAEALEALRVQLARECEVAVSAEMGPRYLHSVGQLQKGGPDTAVVLLLSAEEPADVPVDGVVGSLGNLEKTQAVGDFMTLAARNRRCMHVHLPDTSLATLQAFAEQVGRALAEIEGSERAVR